MLQRTRTRTRTELFGSVWEPVGGVLVDKTGPLPETTYYKSTTDFHKKARRFDGTLPPSNLTLSEEVRIPPTVSMIQKDATSPYVYQDFRNVPLRVGSIVGWAPAGNWNTLEQTDTYYIAKLLAESNPFSYSVSIPIMISELAEAATLLRFAQNNFLTLGGSIHLNLSFGIQPLMQDIRTLYNITREIERKINELNSLISRGGLRKKVFLGRKSWTEPNNLEYSGWSGFSKGFQYWIRPTYTSKVWGTVRWRPSRLTPIETAKLASVNNAIRLVLDLKAVDLSTAWEMIPFSWLVDYFLNVGSALQAVEGKDKVEPYDICLMRTRTIKTYANVVPRSWHNSVSGGLQYTTTTNNGSYSATIKLRKTNILPPQSSSSLLSFGIMSRGQATNLVALLLSIARFR